MNRRSVIAGIASMVPLGTMAVAHAKVEPHPMAVPKAAGRRISTVKGDPGERAYAELCGDGKVAKVFLDGEAQPDCVTVDEQDGSVVRAVRTPSGKLAFNRATGEIYHETVFGEVRVEIVDRGW